MRTEGELVKACLLYLKAKGIVAWRHNAGGINVGKYFVRLGVIGASDIMGLLPGGRFLGVEAKIGKNKPTPDQTEWQRRINEQGGLAFTIWSVDALELHLRNAGVK